MAGMEANARTDRVSAEGFQKYDPSYLREVSHRIGHQIYYVLAKESGRYESTKGTRCAELHYHVTL